MNVSKVTCWFVDYCGTLYRRWNMYDWEALEGKEWKWIFNLDKRENLEQQFQEVYERIT